MTIREEQRDRLRRTVEWARKIGDQLEAIRDRHRGQVHFRPSSTGVSMIGLRPDRPQRGKSRIKDLGRLANDFDRIFREYCVDCDQGRPTREKRLQSYLVAEAYRSDRRLEHLHDGGDRLPPVFVTDELSLPADGGRRLVCDILALDGDVPSVIELKSSRQMKRLVAQVEGYAALVDEHIHLFSELYSAILGREVELVPPCQRWIVWPHPEGHACDPKEGELATLGIRVVGYTEIGDRFTFKAGRPLPRRL